jgi:serine phosphatase RsbU (regulator of sigma subunit)/ligand-binding sensor domain-containing protein
MAKSNGQFQIMKKLSFIPAMRDFALLNFFLFSLFLNLALAQLPDIEFEHYSTREGLAGDAVFDIIQDNEGFLWFAAGGGLSRFDGYAFTNYFGQISDTTSIPPGIFTLFKDRDGLIWVGSGDADGGAAVFNPSTKKARRINYFQGDSLTFLNNQVIDITGDRSGNIWFATRDGLDRYNPQSGISRHFEHDPGDSLSLTGNGIRSLFVDSNGELWVGTGNFYTWERYGGGLNRYEPSTQTFRRYIPGNMALSNTNVNFIGEDNKHILYIGLDQGRVYRYDREKDRLDKVPDIKYSSIPFSSTGEMISGLIFDFSQDISGNYWIGGINGGINRFDSTMKDSRHYKYDPEDNRSVGSNDIFRILQDKQGSIWIATLGGGVNKVVPSRKRFFRLSSSAKILEMVGTRGVNTFTEDAQGHLWMGMTNGDLYRFKGPEAAHWNMPEKIGFNNPREISALYEDSRKRLWLGGTGFGLVRFIPEKGDIKRYIPDVEHQTGLSFWAIMSITEDSNGNLWLGGTYNGTDVFNPQTETFVNYRNNPQEERSLSNNFVRFILKDSDGRIWLGTEDGLNRYHEETKDFDHFLPGVNIRKILEDNKGRLWIGTRHHGLINFNRQTAEYKVFTIDDGLPSNFTNNIVEDNDGNIWIGSPAGLTRFQPETGTIISFGADDGIDNAFTLDPDAVIKLHSGEIILGGTKGITSFSPNQITFNSYPPDVVITDVKSFKNSVTTNGKAGSVITLDYNQNDLTFEYVGLHYTNPLHNTYAVKLEPYEKNWQYVGRQRQARYTNLSPGSYTFSVKAASSDGVWNEEGKKLTIIINPPLWATWWAYGLYIFFALGLLYSIRRYELNRRQEKEENRRKSKELEEARQLQLSMLPKELPQLPHLDIAVYMQTATEVGGDYYDFHVAMDGTFTVVIGDATGHGMKAGTMVTTAKSLFRSYGSNPDILFSFQEFTRCIKEMNFGRMSMCLTMLKIKENTLQISTAGMPPSYIYRKDTKQAEEYEFEAMPLGIMEKFPYKIKDTTLNPGDTILLLSDGLPELKSSNGEMYGYKKIRSSFENIAEQSPKEIISNFKNEGSCWINNVDPEDDVTFVVIKVK